MGMARDRPPWTLGLHLRLFKMRFRAEVSPISRLSVQASGPRRKPTPFPKPGMWLLRMAEWRKDQFDMRRQLQL